MVRQMPRDISFEGGRICENGRRVAMEMVFQRDGSVVMGPV